MLTKLPLYTLLTKHRLRLGIGVITGTLILSSSIFPSLTHAASLGRVFVRFDRMQISTGTTGTVCAMPTTGSTEASVLVSFPTSYTLGAAATFTVSTTNLAWPSSGTAWPGINTATNVTGQNVTFPSTDLTVGTLYCFNWTNTSAVTVKSSATASNIGSVTTQDGSAVAIDTAQYATASISNDQIVVTATVPTAFSFSLSGNTDALGTLSTSSVATSPTPRVARVDTNAKNGWQIWAKDANGGIRSSSASKTIASTTPGTVSTLTAGTEGYNTGVTSVQTGGSGIVTVDPAFTGGVAKGGGLDTGLRSLASSTGTANDSEVTLTNHLAISSTTPAASDYTDTITVVGAGLF